MTKFKIAAPRVSSAVPQGPIIVLIVTYTKLLVLQVCGTGCKHFRRSAACATLLDMGSGIRVPALYLHVAGFRALQRGA